MRAIHTIHPIVMGSKRFDKSMMTYQHDAGTPYVIPIYTWLIKGGDRVVLVDTGESHPLISPDREAALGATIHTFESGLAQHGLTPEDVEVIIHTHLHNDHCENDAKCVNAIIYVHPKELEHLHNPHPLDYRYLEDFLEEVEERGQIRLVQGDGELLPGIRVMHTPAHTEGGLSVLVDTAQGVAAITGCCTILENFDPPPAVRGMELEVIPPGTCVNPYTAYDAMLKVRDVADILLPLHEPAFARLARIG
ncbi:MAG: N-acyl homoserine lactonase family protein [Desulfovibrio sp.]|nr:N-acyl homoserine lactonase family protein [Desulfovibrio sp.]MCA1985017.1 N-acyl homoserine lactonase family protein [Desulfovibrio sp.]